MTTSREALGVGGERAWLVPALALPEAGKPVTRAVAAASKAIRLFVERTQAVRPSFQLIDRKSTRLNSSHSQISYAVFCLKKKKNTHEADDRIEELRRN